MGGGGLLDALTKRVMERVLEGELTEHLGYEKHAREGHNGGNSRNGRTRKRVKTDTSELEIEVPRDRDSTFDPQFVRKGQRRLGGFDEKVRSRGHVQTHAVYLALALNLEGNKELLGLWVGAAEGAKFWLSVLTELRNRGVEDILIASIDGLKGFPEAIESVFPKTQVQLCVVHLVRGSLRFVSWKERKAVARDLRAIYRAPSLEAAETALEAFSERWDERFPVISRKWRANWANLTPFFDYPPEIRKVMYTTNAIEALNAQLTKVTRKPRRVPDPGGGQKGVVPRDRQGLGALDPARSGLEPPP